MNTHNCISWRIVFIEKYSLISGAMVVFLIVDDFTDSDEEVNVMTTSATSLTESLSRRFKSVSIHSNR